MNSLYRIKYWNERTGQEGTVGTLVSLEYGRERVAQLKKNNPNGRFWLVKLAQVGTAPAKQKRGGIR